MENKILNTIDVDKNTIEKKDELIDPKLLENFLEQKDRIIWILNSGNISSNIWYFAFLEMSYNKLSEEQKIEYKEFYIDSIKKLLTDRLWRFNTVNSEKELFLNSKSVNVNIDQILEISPNFDFSLFDNEYLKPYIESYLKRRVNN